MRRWENLEIPADKSRWNRSFSDRSERRERLRDIFDEASKNLGKNTDPAMENWAHFLPLPWTRLPSSRWPQTHRTS